MALAASLGDTVARITGEKTAAPKPASKPAPKASKASASAAPAGGAEAGGSKPATLDAPGEGGADDLKKITGIGPKLEQALNAIGIWHFSQIAAWGEAEVAWVDENLEGFKGRVSRDNWVSQAADLQKQGG